MTQRHTFLFGAVLAVAGAAVTADHYRSGAAGDASQPQNPVEAEAPATAPVPRDASPRQGTENGIIEFAPCSANMGGLMLAPSPSQAAPRPATTPAPAPVPAAKPAPASKPETKATGATPTPKSAPVPKPAPMPAPATPQQDGIIEFAPCAAAF